jgi:hypothetical protein
MTDRVGETYQSNSHCLKYRSKHRSKAKERINEEIRPIKKRWKAWLKKKRRKEME